MDTHPKFKYDSYISNLKFNEKNVVCPPNSCKTIDATVYRWIYDTLDHALTWIPQILKPDVPIRGFMRDEFTYCNAYALSFFTSLDGAVGTFKTMSPKTKNKLGYTNVAVGDIIATDGLTTLVEENRHFNLHEYESCNWDNRFQKINPNPLA